MEKTTVNSSILKWAREQAQLSIEEAARRAGLQDLKPKGEFEGLSAPQRLERWEEGMDSPTFAQLEKVAKAYRRPVLTFFLSAPPSSTSRMADFRTVGDALVGRTDSPEFTAFVRQMESMQRQIRDLLEEEAKEPLPFIGSVRIDTPIKEVVAGIRQAIKFSIQDQTKIRTTQDLFAVIRNKVEEVGILVLVQGNLGSHHTNISTDQFRGLAISDPIAPMIVINPNDPKAARVFSLAHELCHLWLGETGVSNEYALDVKRINQRANEAFCNKVAAEFLVPEDELRNEWSSRKSNVYDRIADLSRRFKVSRIVVARRLLNFNMINEDLYWSFYRQIEAQWQADKERLQESEGAPGYVIRVQSRLGKRLIRTIIEAAQKGKLSFLRASQLMNVKIDHFHKLYGGVEA